MKTAVVLLNLGGPSEKAAIKPFLFNFFMDPNIIGLPKPFRFLLAKWISHRRGSGAANDAYAPLGHKSPLLENTIAQADALQEKLGADHKVFVCMRYWHPMAEETVQAVKDWGAKKVILLPLYPQFSTTTTYSAVENWRQAARKIGFDAPTEDICCYPLDAGFIKASADNIRRTLEKAPAPTRLLFSAHGLPEKVVAGGDPYQWQCEQTAKAIADALNMPGLDWQVCYQSRVGPLKWIGPSTDEAIEQAAADGKNIVIYPHAFVSEHVETLVEIGMEYKHKAAELGVSYFAKVDTVGTHPDFIAGLSALVAKPACPAICPAKFTRCPCRKG